MIMIKKHSGIYTLQIQQELPISLKEAWEFFSIPANLSKITPSDMDFIITSDSLDKIHQGQIISYRISPFAGIVMNWVTEITTAIENHFFVDEQRFGPYKMWHHEHHFEKTNKGTLITDKVSYKLPFGIIGHWAHKLFIKKQLSYIFSYRYYKLHEMFQMQR